MVSSLRAAQILTDLHFCHWTEAQAKFIYSDIQKLSTDEEGELFRLAEQNSALIYTVKQLERLNYSSPLFLQKKIEILPAIEREKNRYQKVLLILEAFGREKIEIIALKGTALGAFLYGDPYYKRMNDFDFLIQLEDLEKVKKTLEKLGYAPVGDLLDKEKNVNSTHHLSPWVSDDLECILGIHWNLISPKRAEKFPVQDLWRDKVHLDSIPFPVYRLSTPHFLMHLMLHLPEFKTGIREAADLVNLIRFSKDSSEALPQIPTLIKKWNASKKCDEAFAWIKALDPISPLLAVPGINLSKEAQSFSKRGAMVLYFRTLQLSRVEKLFAKSWLSLSPAKRIQGWAQSWIEMLFPSFREGMAVLKKSESEGVFGWVRVRLLAPIAIWTALCKDHGAIKIYLVTILNFFAVFLNLLKMILWPPSIWRMHPAEKILDELE